MKTSEKLRKKRTHKNLRRKRVLKRRIKHHGTKDACEKKHPQSATVEVVEKNVVTIKKTWVGSLKDWAKTLLKNITAYFRRERNGE